MIKKFYSIFDSTAKHFLNPLEAKNHGDAIRLFTTFVNGDKENSNIARYPTQFTLFHMYDMDDVTGYTGTYNDTEGKMEKQKAPLELIIGAVCVEENQKQFTLKDLKEQIKSELQRENVVDIQPGGVVNS